MCYISTLVLHSVIVLCSKINSILVTFVNDFCWLVSHEDPWYLGILVPVYASSSRLHVFRIHYFHIMTRSSLDQQWSCSGAGLLLLPTQCGCRLDRKFFQGLSLTWCHPVPNMNHSYYKTGWLVNQFPSLLGDSLKSNSSFLLLQYEQ